MSELFDKNKDFPDAIDVAASLSDAKRIHKINASMEIKAKDFINKEVKDAFWELQQDLLKGKVTNNYVVKIDWPDEPNGWFHSTVKNILKKKGYKIFEYPTTKDAPGSIEIFAGADTQGYSKVRNPLSIAPYHVEIAIFLQGSSDKFNLFGGFATSRISYVKRIAEDTWEETGSSPKQMQMRKYANPDKFAWVLRKDAESDLRW